MPVKGRRMWRGRPGRRRNVDQVLDQPREPPALLDHRLAELVALGRRRAGRVEGGAGGDDRGQRRAQIVGDRAQQRGLELVRAPQRLGLDRLGPHPVALALQLLELGQGPVGLFAAALGLCGAGTGELGEGRAGDRNDHKDDERDEVVVSPDVEPPQRRQVKEVEGEGAEDRGPEAESPAPDRRDQQHAWDVDDTERDGGRDFLQRIDDQGPDGDNRERGDQAEPNRGGLRAQSK